MERINKISNQIHESIKAKNLILQDKSTLKNIDKIISEIIKCVKKGNKIILAGNGGSAADAQHMAAEFVSKFYKDRPSIEAIALTTDTSIITSIGNDYDFSNIFSRQIESIGKNGDIFIAISTSGNSENIINALKQAQEKGIITVGLSGESGGKMKSLCDYCILVPSSDTPRIQESHLLLEHIFCEFVEEELFK